MLYFEKICHTFSESLAWWIISLFPIISYKVSLLLISLGFFGIPTFWPQRRLSTLNKHLLSMFHKFPFTFWQAFPKGRQLHHLNQLFTLLTHDLWVCKRFYWFIIKLMNGINFPSFEKDVVFFYATRITRSTGDSKEIYFASSCLW